MKQRIINALIYFAGLDQHQDFESLFEDICKVTNLTESEVQTKSLHILKFLIPHYASFEISTIDSFNHRIIRTFAKDLKISQHFEVDLDFKFYIKEAIEKIIENVGTDAELTAWLVDFIKYKINNNKSGNISKDLTDYAELIVNENNFYALDQINEIELYRLREIQSEIKDYKASLLTILKEIAQQFFDLIEEHQIEPSNFTRGSIPSYFRKILEDNEIVDAFNRKWHDIENTNFYTAKTNIEVKESIDAIRPQIENLFLESKSKSLEYHLTDRVLKNFVPLAMIKEVQKQLNTLKEENEILFVNDFNRLISNQIRNQPVPYIYERLGDKFQHYFIDEFQDTSTLQWQNLKPLVENAITTQFEDGSFGSLYLVGDVKQSIYEWRGGDPKQFLDLSQNRQNPFSVEPVKHKLEDNWRSAKEIVDFNNGFFQFASKKLTNKDHTYLYNSVYQNHKKENGYVEINFLPEFKQKSEKLDHQINTLKKIIDEQLSLGFAYRDICILVRKNKHGLEISEAFNALENPIPIVSQESLLINSDVRVKLIVKFLKFIHNTNEETSIDFILDWLILNNFSPDYDELRSIKSKPLDEILLFLTHFNIEFNFDFYKKLSLFDKIEYAVQVLNFHKDANSYIQFFLDEAYEYSMSKSTDILYFLDYWDDKKDSKSISGSEDSDAVKITTIHKSKGLEYPIVIVADINTILANLSQTSDWIRLDETRYGIPFFFSSISEKISTLSNEAREVYLRNIEKEELANMNTAYVALTRPKKHLFILSQPISHKKNYNFEDLLKDYLKVLGRLDDEQPLYHFGEKMVNSEITKNEERHHSNFYSFESKRFYDTLTPNETLEKIENKKLIYGKEVHNLLQSVFYREDIESLEVSEDIRSKLEEIVNHDQLSRYFEKDWVVHNEIDLVHNEEILRPDRVCVKGKDAVIFDYKTGLENESHIEQLTSYKLALEAMGYAIKSAYLIYIRKNIFIKSL